MQAPIPASPVLALERVRCSCQTENFIVFAEAWYEGQQGVVVEETCGACGRSLLPMEVAEGAVVVRYTLDTLPDAVARQLGQELVDEVCVNRPAVTEGVPESWVRPHEAPEAYVAWLASQEEDAPASTGMERAQIIQNLAITGVLVVVIALLAIL